MVSSFGPITLGLGDAFAIIRLPLGVLVAVAFVVAALPASRRTRVATGGAAAVTLALVGTLTGWIFLMVLFWPVTVAGLAVAVAGGCAFRWIARPRSPR